MEEVMTKAFDRILIIMLENQLVDAVVGNAFMKDLAGKGIFLSNYFGITHPSQPNYIAAIAGLPMGVTDDSKQDIEGSHLIDLLEAKGISWKAYMENLPADKSKHSKGLYFRKHNPFVSFNSIRNDPARLACIVDSSQLQIDISNGTAPQYCWYTPNIQNDGHTPPADFQEGNPARRVNFVAQWLGGFLKPLQANSTFMKGTLIVVTFDESIPHDQNHVYAALVGERVQPGQVVTDRFDHYSLLRTVEDNFGLGSLNRNDATAQPFAFLWGEETAAFGWSDHSQPAEEA